MKSGQHLLDLIDNILTVVRGDAGCIKLEQKSFDLCRLMRELCEMAQTQAKSGSLAIASQCDRSIPPFIVSDKGKVSQVLLNLIGNAVKFTEQGQVSVFAHAKHLYTNEHGEVRIIVEVADTGCGIEAERQHKIFEAFEQARRGQEIGGGSGLGLALCKQLAQALDGNIEVESEVGKGSKFTFSFSAKIQTDPSCEEDLEESREVKKLARIQAPVKVLVVDDDLPNRDMLGTMLKEVGFNVGLAASGEEALDTFEKGESWDLVLLDKRMPPPDGIATMKRIRKLELVSSPKIIIATASGFNDEREEMLALGVDGFVAKPLRRKQLFAEIGKVLGLKYEYEEMEPRTLRQDSCGREDVEWSAIPAELALRVKQSVNRGDIKRARDIVQNMSGQFPVQSEALQKSLEKYDYQYVLDKLSLRKDTNEN